MGAAATAFYINDAATVMPKYIVAKARTYMAGAYADVLEVCLKQFMTFFILLKIKNDKPIFF